MRFDQFEVAIPQSKEKDGYCILDDKQVFTIRIHNHSDARCNANIKLDGKDIGTFRLNPKQCSELEHPVGSTGRFTFFKSGTLKAIVAGINNVPSELLGLLKVKFIPERLSSGNYTGGKIGLSGKSNQVYGKAPPMNVDEDKAVTINLRIVCDSPSGSSAPLPVKSRETPVPPPL